jgi:hypothetical protein
MMGTCFRSESEVFVDGDRVAEADGIFLRVMKFFF